jgi:hypothetical protein
MVDVKAWAGCSLTQLVCHTCQTPDCMNLVPVLLTWHSTLNNRQLLHTIATYKYQLHAGRVGHGNGLNIRHLLQLPQTLTLSARHLHCHAAILY